MLKNMYYSVELYAEHFVPERNATMKFFLVDESWQGVCGRQDRYHLIRSEATGNKLTTQEL